MANGYTFEEALRAMIEHGRQFPHHGFNCACKDVFSVGFRIYLREKFGTEKDPAGLADLSPIERQNVSELLSRTLRGL